MEGDELSVTSFAQPRLTRRLSIESARLRVRGKRRRNEESRLTEVSLNSLHRPSRRHCTLYRKEVVQLVGQFHLFCIKERKSRQVSSRRERKRGKR